MNILLTCGWCRTTYVVAETLAKSGYKVYVCDSSQLSMTRFSKFVKGFNIVPDFFKMPQQFVEALSKIIEKRKIDILLPMHDDALVIRTYQDILPKNLTIACPDLHILKKVSNKFEIIKIATSAGVDIPATILPESINHAIEQIKSSKFPLVIKTQRGNGGKGVFIVNSVEEAIKTYVNIVDKFGISKNELPLLQEYIRGIVCGSCFLSQNGDIKGYFSERYIRCKEGNFGTSVFRELFQNNLLHEYTQRVVHILNWNSKGHFDFIVDEESSRVVLIEMNPRFWEALHLSVQNGYNFPVGLVKMIVFGKVREGIFTGQQVPKKKFMDSW